MSPQEITMTDLLVKIGALTIEGDMMRAQIAGLQSEKAELQAQVDKLSPASSEA